jgi:hypothetical protein
VRWRSVVGGSLGLSLWAYKPAYSALQLPYPHNNFSIHTSTSTTSMMTPPPSHVSNKALPDFVYALPDNMAPQPSLTRFWCRNSITCLTTQSKKAPDGTTESFIEVLRRPQGYATRKNNFGVCNSCVEAKEGGCVEVCPLLLR